MPGPAPIRNAPCPPSARPAAVARFLAALLGSSALVGNALADEVPPTAPPAASPKLHAASETGPWIFAAEDTLEIPAFFEMSIIEIREDRLSIAEIVERCIAREEELAEKIRSHEYTLLAKSIFSIGGTPDDPDRQLIMERVDRKFFRAGDENTGRKEKTVPLKSARYKIEDGERGEWNPDEDDDPAVELSYGDLTDLPFYLEDPEGYDFDIVSREIVGDRVIYEVRLDPRSDFEIAPSGTIWVDTSTFSILREEFDFEDRVPMPLLVKRAGPFVRERERIGDLWVWKRMQMHVELRGGLLRWIESDIPDVAEFQLVFQDHRVNEGWSTDGKNEVKP